MLPTILQAENVNWRFSDGGLLAVNQHVIFFLVLTHSLFLSLNKYIYMRFFIDFLYKNLILDIYLVRNDTNNLTLIQSSP